MARAVQQPRPFAGALAALRQAAALVLLALLPAALVLAIGDPARLRDRREALPVAARSLAARDRARPDRAANRPLRARCQRHRLGCDRLRRPRRLPAAPAGARVLGAVARLLAGLRTARP